MLIFSIKGFANERLKSRFTNSNKIYLDELSCDFWAQNHLLQTLLNLLVALDHFLSQQKRNILSMDKTKNPTIQLMYQVSKERLGNECQEEGKTGSCQRFMF